MIFGWVWDEDFWGRYVVVGYPRERGMSEDLPGMVRRTVKVTAPAGTVITESAATSADTPDPNLANNTATVSLTVL